MTTNRLLFVLLLLFSAGCDLPGRPDAVNRPVPADQVVSFGVLYEQNCAGCHGAEGKLGPAPPLNDRLFRSIVPASELETVVANGRGKAGGGTLTPAQIQVLVHEIKGMPYKIVAKQDGGRTTTEVTADATGITPTWGAISETIVDAPPYLQPRQRGDSDFGDSHQGAL